MSALLLQGTWRCSVCFEEALGENCIRLVRPQVHASTHSLRACVLVSLAGGSLSARIGTIEASQYMLRPASNLCTFLFHRFIAVIPAWC